MRKMLGMLGLTLTVLTSLMVFRKTRVDAPIADPVKESEPAPGVREPGSVTHDPPRPSAATTAANTASASEPPSESPTGDARMDEAYRRDPEWRKRWDRYRRDFASAQMTHKQPPRPPDPPWVEEERLRNTDHSAPNPFGGK